MVCLSPQNIARHKFDAEAAQLRIATSFRSDFLARYPDGFVTSELEYQGGTTAAYSAPRPLRTPGKPHVNRVLDAMASDFRNWCRERDYRKCDVLGISNDGHHAELLEVTSGENASAAIRQLRSKLSILRETVSRIHHLSVEWQPSAWQPDTKTLFCPLTSTPDEIRYACYEPTLRQRAPRGVVLYELHALPRKLAVNPLPSEVQGLKGRPEADNLVGIYAALSGQTASEVLREYGGSQFSAFKPALIDLAVAKLSPIAAEKRRLEQDPSYIDGVLADGAARARVLAQPIYRKVKEIVGFVSA